MEVRRLTLRQIRFLGDPAGEFTRALDLEFDASAFFGNHRSKRYALVVKDGKVKSAHVEPDSTGTDGTYSLLDVTGCVSRTNLYCFSVTGQQSTLDQLVPEEGLDLALNGLQARRSGKFIESYYKGTKMKKYYYLQNGKAGKLDVHL